MLSRCRPLDGEACGHVFWAEMDHHDAVGSLALEPTAVGLTLFDGPSALATGQHTGGHTSQDHARLDDPDGADRCALVAQALGTGRGRCLCLCAVGLGLSDPPGDLDCPAAPGCSPLRLARARAAWQAGTETQDRPALDHPEIAGGGGPAAGPGDGSRLVWWYPKAGTAVDGCGPLAYARRTTPRGPLGACG